MLFGKETFPNFSQCMIKMVRFKGTSELDDFMDNQQVYGHAFKILTEANEFMRRHLNIASFYQPDDFVRIDKPTVPPLVIREALINAICHRNYQNYSAITLAIFDDRLEVWNSGFLPKELKIEDLKKKHGSYPRNKLIAEVFYKRGLIERWGTGTLKMVERCREHGLPELQFDEYSDGLSVKFLFASLIGPIRSSTNIATKLSSKQSKLVITKKQVEIIALLEKYQELTASSIQDKLVERSIAARTLRDDLMFLKKHNMIGSRGSGKHAIWFKILI